MSRRTRKGELGGSTRGLREPVGLRNCERCGRLFSGIEPLCPACLEKEQDEFEAVRSYLRDHPEASVAQVSAATGVEVQQLHRWARQGRLQLKTEGLEGALRCERCGRAIDSGRLCPRCSAELAEEVKKAAAPRTPSMPPEAAAGPRAPTAPAQPRERAKGKAQVHTIEDIRRRFLE